ncbi:MAG: hypothetical protein IKW90_00275 [Lachnospiraceae bacterium]|nr:hypothetical protein [Lachnospiraceae bacterium]
MSDYKKYSIIMVGGAACKKALSILYEKREELACRYSGRYLGNAEKRLKNRVFLDSNELIDGNTKEDKTAKKCTGEAVVCPCGTAGVFGALWDLGEMLKIGLKVNLYDIPIDQAAIELCDLADINPYESDSTGAYLIAATFPGEIMESLKEKGVACKVIGYTTKENARIITGPSERYLTKP